jgi:hypothetical protein
VTVAKRFAQPALPNNRGNTIWASLRQFVVANTDCKLQIANCKLQIEEPAPTRAQIHAGKFRVSGFHFAFCNLQFAMIAAPQKPLFPRASPETD